MAVSASSSGMPAATSAPNATTRMISVSGTENTRNDVYDGRVESRPARSNGAALDQDALIRRQLEAGIEDPVHAARLAGAGRVRIDLLRADLAADGERDHHERKPAKRGGLPVS